MIPGAEYTLTGEMARPLSHAVTNNKTVTLHIARLTRKSYMISAIEIEDGKTYYNRSLGPFAYAICYPLILIFGWLSLPLFGMGYPLLIQAKAIKYGRMINKGIVSRVPDAISID